MQPNTITVNDGTVSVTFTRFEEQKDSSLYMIRDENKPGSPSTMQFKRTLPVPNRQTGFPGNRRSSIVFKLGSQEVKQASESCTATLKSIASAEISFVIPNWEDPSVIGKLMGRVAGIMADKTVVANLVGYLEI